MTTTLDVRELESCQDEIDWLRQKRCGQQADRFQALLSAHRAALAELERVREELRQTKARLGECSAEASRLGDDLERKTLHEEIIHLANDKMGTKITALEADLARERGRGERLDCRILIMRFGVIEERAAALAEYERSRNLDFAIDAGIRVHLGKETGPLRAMHTDEALRAAAQTEKT